MLPVSETLFGRQAEMARLKAAVLDRQSLLIWGPAGAGKTALVAAVLSGLPKDLTRRCLYVSAPEGLQNLLRHLFRQLYEARDPYLLSKLRTPAAGRDAFRHWLKEQTSLRMRGILYRAAQAERYWIFLDRLPPLSHAGARMVKELVRMRKTPVYVLARGSEERDIGHVSDLYWLRENRLALGPLSEPAARELLEFSIRRFGLSRLDLQDFREEVLGFSERLPGAIVKMCALAADPRYHYGRRIKTSLVHIDSLMGEDRRMQPDLHHE